MRHCQPLRWTPALRQQANCTRYWPSALRLAKNFLTKSSRHIAQRAREAVGMATVVRPPRQQLAIRTGAGAFASQLFDQCRELDFETTFGSVT